MWGLLQQSSRPLSDYRWTCLYNYGSLSVEGSTLERERERGESNYGSLSVEGNTLGIERERGESRGIQERERGRQWGGGGRNRDSKGRVCETVLVIH